MGLWLTQSHPWIVEQGWHTDPHVTQRKWICSSLASLQANRFENVEDAFLRSTKHKNHETKVTDLLTAATDNQYIPVPYY